MLRSVATYYKNSSPPYQATLFISSVTLTIRYQDEHNVQQDVHWLGEKILSLEERAAETELRYPSPEGQAPERLIIRDQAALQEIKKKFAHHRAFAGPGLSFRIFRSGWSKLLILCGIFLLILLSAYLWWLPWLGEKVAMNFSQANEIALGEQLYRSTIAASKVDTHKTTQLNRFYHHLQYNTGYPVSITVLNAGVQNAFAIPGGHIVVYDAILDRIKTPEELAALLGHEASHIALRHSLRNMFRTLARKMFLSLVVGSESGIAAVVVNNADALKGLEYSRELETEADDNGLQLMSRSGIDPQGMLRLMQLLQAETGDAGTAGFLSTHPVFDKRIDHIKMQLSKLPVPSAQNDTLSRLFHEIYETPNW